MPIWGLSTESDFASPPPDGGKAGEPKRRRWRGRAGDRGKHDSHRPFTNRKAAPGEGTVIRARVGRPVPSGARSAQGPVHFPPTWRVIMGRCHPGQPGQGRRARQEGGMGAFAVQSVLCAGIFFLLFCPPSNLCMSVAELASVRPSRCGDRVAPRADKRLLSWRDQIY